MKGEKEPGIRNTPFVSRTKAGLRLRTKAGLHASAWSFG